jgi:hypothetical protein
MPAPNRRLTGTNTRCLALAATATPQAYKPKVFKTPDGAEFPSRREVFKYWFNFTDKEGETLVRPRDRRHRGCPSQLAARGGTTAAPLCSSLA